MTGVLLTLLVALGASGIGRLLLSRTPSQVDPAARWGMAAVLGLGSLGFLTLLIESVPGGIRSWGLPVVGLLVLLGLANVVRHRSELKMQRPMGMAIAAPLVVAVGALVALVGVITPSDMNDWDTLAYHLAVPKLWIEAGHAFSVPFIHHSNFPFTVDNLYIWGLQYGGESGAKAFMLAFYLAGAFLTFGFARMRFDASTAWWAMVAYATVPVVLWESGSAYIDVAQGLFTAAGLVAIAFALEDEELRSLLTPGAISLGFAAGSKYTGLQTFIALGITLVVLIGTKKVSRSALGALGLAAIVAVGIAAPWYVRNQANVQNPVYPFFYEKLGGKNWDARRAAIYKNEQQSFGVGQTETGGRDPLAAGHAVLGLAYQPGRYVNPAQTLGMGSPLGAVGVAVVAMLLVATLMGGAGVFGGTLLGVTWVSLLMWVFLSQQSRYIVPLTVPIILLGAGALRKPKIGPVLQGLIGLQAAYSLFLFNQLAVQPRLPVALGKVSPQEYRLAAVPFAEVAKSLNETVKPAKVALYDEVFGYLLDVPYFWANPGHSTLIPYDSINTPEEFVAALDQQGISHVYVNLSPVVLDRGLAQEWLAAMQGTDFPSERRESLLQNWESKWRVLVSDSVRSGKLVVVQQYRQGLLFQVQKG